MISRTVADFDTWRRVARDLIAREAPPCDVSWCDAYQSQGALPFDPSCESPGELDHTPTFPVPKQFVELAKHVACHRSEQRWHRLYQVLWRIRHGEPDLLDIAVDEQVHALRRMQQAVRRDIHKMHAFVRFERSSINNQDEFLAYYRPDHRIVRLAVPFFVERFTVMRWKIFGPDETAVWDGHKISFLPGVPLEGLVTGDALTQLWQTYYAATFNPARLNVKQMRREMPGRFWPLLPETREMEQLVAEAAGRTQALIENGAPTTPKPLSAQEFLPEERDLGALALAARACQGCSLHACATQTVFGEGPVDARIVLVGEQPGDQEDLTGRPFIGPAGQLLDELLAAAGIDRSAAYVTNAVKHFKWIERGKRRLHSKPTWREVHACRPWLEAELRTIQPQVLVLLGATAAQAVFGPQFRIQRQRGQPQSTEWSLWTMATYHPSALLRARDAAHATEMRGAMLHDLRLAAVEMRQGRKDR